jgi:hypothetical protein
MPVTVKRPVVSELLQFFMNREPSACAPVAIGDSRRGKAAGHCRLRRHHNLLGNEDHRIRRLTGQFGRTDCFECLE